MTINLTSQPEAFRLYIQNLFPQALEKNTDARFTTLRRFHQWLKQHSYTVETLTASQADEYSKYHLTKTKGPQRRQIIFHITRNYLTWLYENGHSRLDPAKLKAPIIRPTFAKLEVVLPNYADEYLGSLVTHLRPSSRHAHRVSVRHLHNFLAQVGFDIAEFGDKEMRGFLEYLVKRKIGPSSRCGRMVLSRMYLRWLYERGLVKNDPDFTLRKIQLPRIPLAMPRPLSLNQDQLFEQYFLASPSFLTQGFYIMRHAGLRIGELKNLPFDCIRINIDGQALLKVPIGKLANDRLVPLTPKTFEVIKKIQTHARQMTPNNGEPQALFVGRHGRPLGLSYFFSAFADAKQNLILGNKIVETKAEPINPHRLRHTFATTLLTGGMNIVVLQKLLGHRAIRMTLRYAAVVPSKVIDDYFAALKVLATQNYIEAPETIKPLIDLGHRKILADLVFMLKKRTEDAAPAKSRRGAELIRKAEQLSRDISKL